MGRIDDEMADDEWLAAVTALVGRLSDVLEGQAQDVAAPAVALLHAMAVVQMSEHSGLSIDAVRERLTPRVLARGDGTYDIGPPAMAMH